MAAPQPIVQTKPVVVPPVVFTPAPKRSATSDLTQPANKKSKVVLPRSHPSEDVAGTAKSGILTTLTNRFSSPFPIHDPEYVQILTVNMNPYFGSLWRTLVNALYPDGRYAAAGMITEANWCLVCRYLTKARVDHIYSGATGRRPANRIVLPRDIAVPKALADIINDIGVISIAAGGLTLIPSPEPDPDDAALRLTVQVNYAVLQAYSRLVFAAHVRGFISTAHLSTDGAAWWALSALNSFDPAVISNGNSDNVVVKSMFKEWTPVDGLLCALVQRQNNGIYEPLTAFMWSFDDVRGIPRLREAFNLGAC